MWKFLLFLALTCYLGATDPLHAILHDTVEEWKSNQYRRSLSYIKLPGVIETSDSDKIPTININIQLKTLPEYFDARKKWPYCPSLKEIRDQGSCGSCWAVSSASVMTDRYCIYYRGAKKFHFSAEDIATCAPGWGCDGGHPASAFYAWSEYGFVSGGSYGSCKGCKPYTIPPRHHAKNYTHNLGTPKCTRSCIDRYKKSYKNDKKYGDKHVYRIQGEISIMTEILKKGPIVASFQVYEDFANYTSGVYRHKKGKALSRHAVKLMGWGVENGDMYWLAANSWGTDFGEKGYFKILRGSNECLIEDFGVASAPRLKK